VDILPEDKTMTSHKNRIVNRLNDLAHEGRNRVEEMSGEWRKQGRVAVRRAQRQLRSSGDAIMAAEGNIVRTVKAHPLAFALVGVAVASLVAAGLLLNNYRSREE
jgi:hypothetical protein